MLLSEATKAYEADKKIEGFSLQTLNAYNLQAKLRMEDCSHAISYFRRASISIK